MNCNCSRRALLRLVPVKLRPGLLVEGGPDMQREQHFHLDELMKPDLLSEIVLTGGALAVVVSLLFVLSLVLP